MGLIMPVVRATETGLRTGGSFYVITDSPGESSATARGMARIRRARRPCKPLNQGKPGLLWFGVRKLQKGVDGV
ncbi:MAG: hypothetical protein V4610_22705, partial [Pseudomonadota bacterium]